MGLTRYVGFDRGFSSAHFDQSVQDELANLGDSNGQAMISAKQQSVPPGIRAESGLATLPATIYQQPQKLPPEEVAVPYGAPIRRPESRDSGSRSPRFHEHLVELDDPLSETLSKRGASQIDSPTLGRHPELKETMSLANNLRRQQHLMTRSNYEPGQTNSNSGDRALMAPAMTSRSSPSAPCSQELRSRSL